MQTSIIHIVGSIFFCFLTVQCSNENKDEVVLETSISDESAKVESPQNTTPINSEIKPGEYFEYHESGGIKIKGFYNNNLLREGLWISYYENGTKWSEAYYVDGKRDGHNLTFYPNGKVRYIGEYKNDLKVGEWSFYDEAGILTKTENY